MSKTMSLLSALLCTFIWGTTFIAQETGMDEIGPFTFNSIRFFVGCFAIVPLAYIFEYKNFRSSFQVSKKTFFVPCDFNWFIFIFRLSITTGSFNLYRCSKCSIFYYFLCANGSNNSFFFFIREKYIGVFGLQ
jgi:drug/metabolite transporter (DMT)-like permease